MRDDAQSQPSPSARLRRDAASNRDRIIAAAERVFAAKGTSASLEDVARAAGVGPATLYRRFANKEALVREALTAFFIRLIGLAAQAETAPADRCVDVYLETVGWELADKSGFDHIMWGDLAPRDLVFELADRTAALLARAQAADAMRADLTLADITAAIWALRGVIQGADAGGPHPLPADAWKRHLGHMLAAFRQPAS